ncbi:MAG: Hsp20/alpha crystallin family protein [Promethearchaeota archaeon]
MKPHDPKFIEFFNLPPFNNYFSPKDKDLLLQNFRVLMNFIPLNKLENFMPYDLTETPTKYIVDIPLPGLAPEDINIALSADNRIHIEADLRKTPISSKNHKQHCQVEWSKLFWQRPIHVEIPIENPVDPNLVKAKLERGILHVEFSKIK